MACRSVLKGSRFDVKYAIDHGEELASSLVELELAAATAAEDSINLRQFIIEQVAGMENEITSGQNQLGADFLQRKIAGNAIECNPCRIASSTERR